MRFRAWYGVLAMLVACAAAGEDNPILAVNGNFEASKPSQGWNVPSHWRIVEGEGRKGSRALAWDSNDPRHFSFPVQHVVLEPGERYAFGAWVKTVRGKPSPQVCLGWLDATNGWISCVYAQPVTDNDAHTDGWTRYEGHTPPLPSNAAKGMLHAHMKRGETGRVLYDDFAMEAEGSEMISYMATSAFRNAFVRTDGAIRFVAPLCINTLRHPIDGLSAEFTFVGSDGKAVVRPADRFAADLAEMTCDATQFACGTQQVALCIRDKASGVVLARKTRRIVQTENPIHRRVTFDSLGRTLLDGKPFFPLGCFSGRMDAETIAVYKKGPFNFFMPYGVVEKDELDRYAAAGLMVVPCVMHKVHGLRYSVTSPFKTEAESHAWFRQHVGEVGRHPALLAWFLVDEVPLAYVPNVASVNDLLEEIDPDHPTWAVTDKPKHARALLPCYDVIGMDPYPIGNKKMFSDIGICSGWARQTRKGMFDMRPMWHVPQAFSWAWYRKDPSDIPPDVHMPTRQEMANMCWQGVAAGANGLCLYSFGGIRKNLTGKDFDAAWGDVCDVAREVKRMEKVLLSDGAPMVLSDVPEDRLVARAWRHEGRDWVLVANRSKEPVKARLGLPRAFRAIETAAGGGVALEGRALVVDLPYLGYAFVSLTPEPSFAERADALFAIGSPANRISPADCGLVNGHVTFNGWLTDVAEVRGIFAPPYYSTDFDLILRVNGENVQTSSHVWRPEVLRRTGTNGAWRVTSRLYPIVGERAGILEIDAENISKLPQRLLVNCLVGGGAGGLEKWQFGKPGLPPLAVLRYDDCIAVLDSTKDDAQVAVALPGGVRVLDWRDVKPGERRRFHVSFAIGRKGEALACVKRLRAAPAGAIERSVADWRRRVKALFDRFPALETDSPELLQVYCRSLLHLLLNEWNVPEFKLHPYYATGGMNGGCVGNYLWNHGEVYRLWPMLDPEAAKAHLRAFLRLELDKCFAFEPMGLKPFGPYYPVNQEKVLLLAHAYVLETGDKAFLNETLDGRPIIERLVAEALAHDDLTKPAVLVDYGYGNHHLELRKEYRYDGVIPDMNLRRAVCFRLADELCRLAGYDPKVDFRARSDALKRLVRKELWNDSVGWFDNVEREKGGRRDRRWTMQMFKAIGWGDWALDADVEHALVRHLMDESEFLGPYGLHSLSRKDPAYDENDVDNGGPGACVSFAPAIVDRLYRSGRPAEAGKIFKRLWWLGGALPYWGDSHYADRMDYRRDTPLQNDIQGAALAQTVIFGTFGVEPRMDGSIAVTPHLPEGVDYMCLRGLKIAGREFDVVATRSRGVEVQVEGRRIKEVNGGTMTIPPRTAAQSVSGENLMPNGDFEDGENGWRVMRPDARVEKGMGFGGTAGFVFEMQEGKEPAWPHSERFPVEGGYAYKVEGRMRLEDFHLKEGASFSLSLAAYDKDGQAIRGVGATLVRITDNDVRTDGWFRAEGVSKVFPMETKTAGFYIWTPKGCYGKAQIDDLKVTPVAANPMELMFTSRYRDEAFDGEVSFRAAYVVNPVRFPQEGLRAELEYLSTGGWTRVQADMSATLVSATVPVKSFEPGCNAVRFVLRQKDGTELGRTQCFFTRTASRPSRKVDFDSFGRTIVDGKPFFPLGMFYGRVTETNLRTLVEGPFNCIMPYKERDEDFALAARYGVKVIYHLSGEARNIDAALPERAEEIHRRHFAAHVKRLRDKPNLLAWYVADETPAAFRTILRERRLMVHGLDPDHPTWAVLDQVGSVRPLADGFDCLGMDPYPIGNRGDKTRTAIGIASSWPLAARNAMYDTRPMWHVPQCFNWAHYRKEEAKTNPNLRWPTMEELRTMTWQPIAAGANGLIYYSFFDIHDANRGWPKELVDQKWREVCRVANEVKAKEDVLLADPGPAVERCPEGIVARTWRTPDGKVHVLVCNTLREPVSGTVSFGGLSLAVDLPPMGVDFRQM